MNGHVFWYLCDRYTAIHIYCTSQYLSRYGYFSMVYATPAWSCIHVMQLDLCLTLPPAVRKLLETDCCDDSSCSSDRESVNLVMRPSGP